MTPSGATISVILWSAEQGFAARAGLLFLFPAVTLILSSPLQHSSPTHSIADHSAKHQIFNIAYHCKLGDQSGGKENEGLLIISDCSGSEAWM